MQRFAGMYTVPLPHSRRLRVFALDPSLGIRLETAGINEATVEILWEEVGPGPVGEYVEVVDVDPASRACYPPVDLNHPHLLAQDGLKPSEGSPQFHQQMVYAVVMNTIGAFEEALGRPVLWRPRLTTTEAGNVEVYVQRLRIYPHALRARNAYYDPTRVALLLGYFPAASADPASVFPGGMIFTCLSHDIVTHETAHALLDGMHGQFTESSNEDILALHEAFADIVALFQHFSYPEVLRYQIARSRGDLQTQNLLAELAQQFGQATGHRGGLRDALGRFDPETGEWKRWQPDRQAIHRVTEPHNRGAILVAAVFDAFLGIYQHRIRDLLRIATGGSSELPPGELHPDLVSRLAKEAAKAARHVLRMCIRALDYLPPVDVTFGDYLRALITADVDMVQDDRYNYRVAFIEAFFRHGIDPSDVRHLSEDSLAWQEPAPQQQDAFRQALRSPAELRRLIPDWGLTLDRAQIYRGIKKRQTALHDWFSDPGASAARAAARLAQDEGAPGGVYRTADGRPELEVLSVYTARRLGPDGARLTDLVVEMTQRRRGYFDPIVQRRVDSGEGEVPVPDFDFRGGSTLLIDLETGDVRYCISKSVRNEPRLEAQRHFRMVQSRSRS